MAPFFTKRQRTSGGYNYTRTTAPPPHCKRAFQTQTLAEVELAAYCNGITASVFGPECGFMPSYPEFVIEVTVKSER